MVKQSIIFAGGRGGKIGDACQKIQKCIIPVKIENEKRPLLEFIINSIERSGIEKHVIITGHLEEQVKKCLEGRNHIKYVRQEGEIVEGYERRLGTGQALKLAMPYINVNEPFLVIGGDAYISPDDIKNIIQAYYAGLEKYKEIGGVLGMIYADNRVIQKLSSVKLEGEIIRDIIEKPKPCEIITNKAVVLCYVLNNKIIPYLKDLTLSMRGEYEITEALYNLIRNHTVIGQEVKTFQRHITTLEDVINARN